MFKIDQRHDFDIEDLIRRAADKQFSREYNCDMRRLFPWSGTVDTKRPMTEYGTAWVVVRAGEEVEAHRHDEEEAFIVVGGQADLEVEGQTTRIGAADVVYLPRFWQHQLRNPYDQDFQFIDIYWDHRGRGFEEFAADQRAEAEG